MADAPRIKLSSVLEAFEFISELDPLSHYVDRQTGEVIAISESDMSAAENEDEDEDDSIPDWQLEIVEAARMIDADESGRFLMLPERTADDDWRMMADFVASVKNDGARDRLERAIHGRGAFRCFRDAIHDLGVEKAWRAWRDDAHRRLAIGWLNEHGLAWEDDQPQAPDEDG